MCGLHAKQLRHASSSSSCSHFTVAQVDFLITLSVIYSCLPTMSNIFIVGGGFGKVLPFFIQDFLFGVIFFLNKEAN